MPWSGPSRARAYLIGDENFSYRDYFQLIFDLAGAGRTLTTRDESHPFLPDWMIVPGRGAVIRYEPDPAVVELLGYRRNDVLPTLRHMASD
ncbi:MAG: hypothetical protein H0X12_01705 [Nocardioides sp.]|nr:hypothetical protein [Nocardioides sp.]